MSISMGPAEGSGDGPSVIADINTTPLVDVMLVLLIIFLITVPVAIQTVPLTLPKQTSVVTTTKPENVALSVTGSGEVYWNQQRIESNEALRERGAAYLAAEVERMKRAGAKIELPEVHIRGDANTEYKNIGGVIFAMQRAGYQKIGFIAEPTATTGAR